jgi:AcrR family transcriptional regulator
MKPRKRLTRQESKEVTRARIVEAAERVFTRKGFDDASVEEISETAGYSRGAFYSNFDDKEQLFLAVIDTGRPKALDTFQQISDPTERTAAVREWFANQWRLKDFIALRLEFTRRAMRDRAARKHLAELRRTELETYADSVKRYLCSEGRIPADRPEIVALVLMAVAHGLGSLAADTDPEFEALYMQAARLAFDRLIAPSITHLD